MLKPTSLLSFETEDSKYLYYNIINQTMVKTSILPEEINDKVPSKYKEKLLFATEEQELINYNSELYELIRKELVAEKSSAVFFSSESEIALDLWYACNFNCPYCYQQYPYFEKIPEEKMIDTQKVVNFFKVKSNNGEKPPKTVVLIGGEPLLKGKKFKETIYDVLLNLHDLFNELEIKIVTNGYHLDEYFELFAKLTKFKWIFVTTLGVTKEKHRKERVLRAASNENTFTKIKRNLEELDSILPNSKIIIRLNFNSDFCEIGETIAMMTEVKTQFPNFIFELSPVRTSKNHLSFNSPFMKLIQDLSQDSFFKRSFMVKIPEITRNIIGSTTSSDEEKQIVHSPVLCNAYTFSAIFDISPSFLVQPCEEFRFYEHNPAKKTYNISSVALEELDKKVEDCVKCPFFQYCIYSPCEVLNRKNQTLSECFNLETDIVTVPINSLCLK